MKVSLGTLAVVAVMAGCGPDRAGSAVVYGSDRITDEVVAAKAATLATALKLPIDKQITGVTVQRLTSNAIVEEAAAQAGITVTQGQVDALIDEAVQSNGGRAQFEQLAIQQGLLPEDVPLQARISLLASALGEKLAPGADQQAASSVIAQDLVRVSNELKVTVSPRFGVWDSNQLRLDAPPNDLSKPLLTNDPTQLLPTQ
jgi:hypothetical protein